MNLQQLDSDALKLTTKRQPRKTSTVVHESVSLMGPKWKDLINVKHVVAE